MKKMIVFVQASRDIIYALKLYKINRDKYDITFYVIDHENNYNYLKSLGLINCRIEFIPNYSLRLLTNIFREKFRLARLYRKEFSDLSGAKVYFFCNYFDFKTFYFVSRLACSNKVIFYNHYKMTRKLRNDWSPAVCIKLAIIWFVTGILFQISGQGNTLQLDYEKFPIEETYNSVNKKDLEEYLQLIEADDRSVLLFETNIEGVNPHLDYKLVLDSVINFLLSHNYAIYVKPHPRLGVSSFMDGYPVRMLDRVVPIELMDLSKFSYAIGNTTAALAGCDEIESIISFMLLIDFVDDEVKSEYHGYLMNLDSSIQFPATFTEFKKLIRT